MAIFDYIKRITDEDDYVERGGTVEELTVTITLCEYRRLIRDNVEQGVEIERLRAEVESLSFRNDILEQERYAEEVAHDNH